MATFVALSVRMHQARAGGHGRAELLVSAHRASITAPSTVYRNQATTFSGTGSATKATGTTCGSQPSGTKIVKWE